MKYEIILSSYLNWKMTSYDVIVELGHLEGLSGTSNFKLILKLKNDIIWCHFWTRTTPGMIKYEIILSSYLNWQMTSHDVIIELGHLEGLSGTSNFKLIFKLKMTSYDVIFELEHLQGWSSTEIFRAHI